jgi:hypothetical protein
VPFEYYHNLSPSQKAVYRKSDRIITLPLPDPQKPQKLVAQLKSSLEKENTAGVRRAASELCHHLDYTLLGLDDSFHTEGFFRRESHLFTQLYSKR